ncbi:MAG: hypothetical protein CMJ32_11815 [Phycisphaerae bacterium]|nr:hypothetical protein [Phycisphaerae bacterium]
MSKREVILTAFMPVLALLAACETAPKAGSDHSGQVMVQVHPSLVLPSATQQFLAEATREPVRYAPGDWAYGRRDGLMGSAPPMLYVSWDQLTLDVRDDVRINGGRPSNTYRRSQRLNEVRVESPGRLW